MKCLNRLSDVLRVQFVNQDLHDNHVHRITSHSNSEKMALYLGWTSHNASRKY